MIKSFQLISSLVCLVIIFIYGCSSSKTNEANNYIFGEIQMVGNQPFTNLAIRNETSFYLLDCTGAVRDSIYHNQGQQAEIFFDSSYTNKEAVTVLKVNKVKVIPGYQQNNKKN
jgi:hypothetical protein